MAESRSAADSERGERREVHYSGHVQGVGFRYTVRHLAGSFHVAGFVRNLPDGRVQLVAEGQRGELTRFLAAIGDEMASYIHDTAIDIRPAAGGFQGFDIRY
jgi:acylphosphatase